MNTICGRAWVEQHRHVVAVKLRKQHIATVTGLRVSSRSNINIINVQQDLEKTHSNAGIQGGGNYESCVVSMSSYMVGDLQPGSGLQRGKVWRAQARNLIKTGESATTPSSS